MLRFQGFSVSPGLLHRAPVANLGNCKAHLKPAMQHHQLIDLPPHELGHVVANRAIVVNHFENVCDHDPLKTRGFCILRCLSETCARMFQTAAVVERLCCPCIRTTCFCIAALRECWRTNYEHAACQHAKICGKNKYKLRTSCEHNEKLIETLSTALATRYAPEKVQEVLDMRIPVKSPLIPKRSWPSIQ